MACPHRVWAEHIIVDVTRGIPSMPLCSTHGRAMSDVRCHHCPGQHTRSNNFGLEMTSRHWTGYIVTERRAWHDIIVFGQHTQTNNIGCGMSSSPLESTHGLATLTVACHHGPWTTLGVACPHLPSQHTRLDDVGRGMLSSPLDRTQDLTILGVHTQSDDVEHYMQSSPLYNTHGRRMSGVACHHYPYTTYSVRRRWHTRSNDVGRGMSSSPLESIHDGTPFLVAGNHHPWTAHTIGTLRWSTLGRTTSGVACHHLHSKANRWDYVGHCIPSSTLRNIRGRMTPGLTWLLLPWTTHMVGRRRAWYAIIALGKNTRTNYVGRDMPSWPLANTEDEIGRGMPSSPWCSTHGLTTSGDRCHHSPWEAHKNGLFQAWHPIIDLGQHTRSIDVGHGMPSSPLNCIQAQTTSGVAFLHGPWETHQSDNVAHEKPSLTLDRTQALDAIITLGQHTRLDYIGCYITSCPWTSHTVGRCQACHTMIALPQHTLLDDVENVMPSSPVDSIHGRTTSDVANHHLPWTAYTVELCRAWHAIITFGMNTRSDDVEHRMP
ncbi:hypothetical protein EJD97_009164 [Solanum chilense]|uniref:Uncharacterized protein n=1 Tax=Solanum chilense TaxID=4083 RepID=A0A6N2AIE2_SOLCI|nr:hypothetical protein EJD97_009164 [Solanum chilense]